MEEKTNVSGSRPAVRNDRAMGQRQPKARREYIHPKLAVRQRELNGTRPHQYRDRSGQDTQRAMQRESFVSSNRPGRQNKSSRKKGGPGKVTKKKITLKKVLIIVLSVIVGLFLIFNIILLSLVGKVNIVKTGKRDDTIKATMSDKNVKNILIIGSDTRDPNTKGRTDVMMIMSVNTDKKEITLISLMRDMYLPLVGYYNDGTKMYNDDEPDGLYRNKLNSAYVFGGPELLMDTITYNFGIEIDDYIYIDFNSFVSIVDSIGGITAEVTKEEVEAMNECTLEQNRLMGNPEKQDFLERSGTVELNGNQTLSFARMRRVGNADFQRTQRQRIVMNKIIEKVNKVSVFKKYSFLKAVLSSLTTNMLLMPMERSFLVCIRTGA